MSKKLQRCGDLLENLLQRSRAARHEDEHSGIVADWIYAERSVQEVVVVVALLVVETWRQTERVMLLQEVELQVVLRTNGEVAAIRATGSHIVDIATGDEVGGATAPCVLIIGVGYVRVARQLEAVALVEHGIVQATALRRGQSA